MWGISGLTIEMNQKKLLNFCAQKSEGFFAFKIENLLLHSSAGLSKQYAQKHRVLGTPEIQ